MLRCFRDLGRRTLATLGALQVINLEGSTNGESVNNSARIDSRCSDDMTMSSDLRVAISSWRSPLMGLINGLVMTKEVISSTIVNVPLYFSGFKDA